MSKKFIEVFGARENNLKNINVKIPKEEFVIITGVSGSGKSSLAFEVLYNEGRRRYVDSLSNYARQFIGGTTKPDVDSIEGLSPAIAIDQKTTSNNPRSTVGTITEIYDYYRLLFARIGKPFCPNHKIEISATTITEITNDIFKNWNNKMISIFSPKLKFEKGNQDKLILDMKNHGFLRILLNDEIIRLDDEKIKIDPLKKNSISILVDRINVNDENRGRIFDAVQISTEYSHGFVDIKDNENNQMKKYSSNYSCPYGDFFLDEIEPKIFSFNSPHGSCKKCSGLGMIEEVKWEKLTTSTKSILEGGINYFGEKLSGIDWQSFEALLRHYEISLTKKIKTFSEKEKKLILFGSDEPIHFTINSTKFSDKRYERIEGIAEKIWRRYEQTTSNRAREYYKKFMGMDVCNKCNGARLNENTLSIKINKINIFELTKMSISDSKKWIENLQLTSKEQKISKLILAEIKSRFEFLSDVGLHYLTLDRIAGTLSGGESQRIRLASQLGSRLTGVIYVLDEPSIGLHQRDNGKLIKTLKSIRDLGNSVIVVEHDEETMYESDYIIDIGPNAGSEGGEIVAIGTPDEVAQKNTHTGNFLSGRDGIWVPKTRRSGNGKVLKIINARENNLQNITLTIPLGIFNVVSGVSGSGKSTLINEVLYKSLYNKITKNGEMKIPGKHDKIEGWENIDKIISINQHPIGKTPRSNPATYTSVFDDIRDLFAMSPESKIRGYEKGRFSFNVPGGRCDKCNGDGIIKIPMHFLPDVNVICDQCNGKRYNEETLQIKYKNKTIFDVLEMSVSESLLFFETMPKIYNKLKHLYDVGLGYIKLGHSATLLSGGEAQRVKLAFHLQKKPTGKTLYILDEPTTGLHSKDIKLLLNVLNKLVEGGDTLIVIEHNIDVIKSADYIIDLGPDGGIGGGKIIATGTPEQISNNKFSVTGLFVAEALKK